MSKQFFFRQTPRWHHSRKTNVLYAMFTVPAFERSYVLSSGLHLCYGDFGFAGNNSLSGHRVGLIFWALIWNEGNRPRVAGVLVLVSVNEVSTPVTQSLGDGKSSYERRIKNDSDCWRPDRLLDKRW